jgi:hypothetical protein
MIGLTLPLPVTIPFPSGLPSMWLCWPSQCPRADRGHTQHAEALSKGTRCSPLRNFQTAGEGPAHLGCEGQEGGRGGSLCA